MKNFTLLATAVFLLASAPSEAGICKNIYNRPSLDVWDANRHEDHWGTAATGYPALDFMPECWDEANMAAHNRTPKDNLHFGFGHGPRVCPGKHLGELEVSLTVAAFVKVFKFTAVNPEVKYKAAVSTKPADGVDLMIELRRP